MLAIEVAYQIKSGALGLVVDALRVCEIENRAVAIAEERALIDSGQEAGTIALRPPLHGTIGHHYIGGEVLIF